MTMEDVLYMGMKNDMTFLITDIANMYEQQSTYNPNMPIRKLMYAARFYDKYIHLNKLNIYGTRQLRLPIPKLVTFYNGKDDREDSILELKDAFKAKDGHSTDVEADIQVRVRISSRSPIMQNVTEALWSNNKHEEHNTMLLVFVK